MKQHITPEQLSELTPKGKEKLREWWKPREANAYELRLSHVVSFADASGPIPCLSIGQLIEFLEDYLQTDLAILLGNKTFMFGEQGKDYNTYKKSEELIDALWSAAKEILNA